MLARHDASGSIRPSARRRAYAVEALRDPRRCGTSRAEPGWAPEAAATHMAPRHGGVAYPRLRHFMLANPTSLRAILDPRMGIRARARSRAFSARSQGCRLGDAATLRLTRARLGGDEPSSRPWLRHP